MPKGFGVLIFLFLAVVAGGVFYAFFYEKEASYDSQFKAEIFQSDQPGMVSEIETKAPALAVEEEKVEVPPAVILSSAEPEQGDVVIVRAISKTSPSGIFESGRIDFFETKTKEWFAVLGINTKTQPGLKKLAVEFADGSKEEREITVQKRTWPTTALKVSEELAEKGYTPENITQTIVQNENVIVGEVISGYRARPYFSEEFVYPLEKIVVVGAFGNIRKSGASELQHLGADLDAKTGTEVFAVNDGVVVLSRSDFTNYGKTVILDHGLGIFSLYLHLSEIKVVLDQSIKRGQVIALSGNSGYSIDPHLHFSVKIRGANIDPLRFIETFNKAFR